MKVDGQCHCGAIVYEAEIDEEKVVICHCTDCQVLSGTAFRHVVFTVENGLTFTRGAPRIYIKTAASGNKREQGFCADCGTPLFATSVGDGPKIYGLRGGSLRQIAALKPRRQVWAQSAHSWTQDIGSLPSIQQQP